MSREELIQNFRDYQQKVAGWLHQRFWLVMKDDDYTQSEDYQNALEEYRKFQKIEGVDYTPVIPYARSLYERYDQLDRHLDEKADSIIKYLGGGTALFTFGALLSVRAEAAQSQNLAITFLACLFPSLVFAIAAIVLAIWVRWPRDSASLPDVGFSRKMAEFYKNKDDFELNTYLMLSPICEASHFRCIRKAKWLSYAHFAYGLSIAFLLLPVFGVGICLALTTPKP